MNNDRKTHNFFSVPLVITEEQAPRTQMFPEGGSARIKCAPQGEVTVSWMDRNNARIEASRKIYYFIQLQQFCINVYAVLGIVKICTMYVDQFDNTLFSAINI